MNKNAQIAIVAIVALILGWWVGQGGQTKVDPDEANLIAAGMRRPPPPTGQTVRIIVKEYGRSTLKSVRIKVVPPILQMAPGIQTITFKLEAANYSWAAVPADAIAFKNAGGMKATRAGRSADELTVVNDNTDGLDHAYTIKLVRDGTTETLTIDPTIRNNH